MHAGPVMRVGLAVALLIQVLLATTTEEAAATATPVTCPTASTDGPWTTLAKPDFIPGPLVNVEVGGPDDRLVLVTDLHVVARSDDGGCTWREIHRIPPQTDRYAVVRDIEVTSSDGDDVVLVSVASTSGFVVLRSVNGSPLEPVQPSAFVGGPTERPPCQAYDRCQMLVSEADPSRVYVPAGGNFLAGGGTLWRSDDAGATFDLVHAATVDPDRDVSGNELLDVTGPFQVNTDPDDPDALVAVYYCDNLARSEDGGRTWSVVPRPGDPENDFSGLAARRPAPGAPQRLLAVEVGGLCNGTRISALHGSLDGGVSWRSLALEGPDLHSVQLDADGATGLVVDEDGIAFRIDMGPMRAERLVTPEGVLVYDPEPLSEPGAFALAAPDQVLILELDAAPAVPDAPPSDRRPGLPSLEPCPDAPAEPRAPTPSTLDVAGDVEVPVGGRADVPAVGRAGAGPVPVDLVFLLDDSGSMRSARESLGRSVVSADERLRTADVDLRAGLGRYGDLALLPYQQMLDVVDVDCRIEQRITQLGGQGQQEPHLLALRQVVVGDGVPELGLPAGEDMAFRSEAIRLVLHATDEPLERDLAYSPTVDELGAVYRQADVTHVGIHVEGTNLAGTEDDLPIDADQVRSDLAEISTATGSLAGAPIDCNGDGLTDVGRGDPLVCGFDADLSPLDGVLATELGSVAAQVVEGLVGPVEVALTVEDAPSGITASVSGVESFDPRDGGEVPGELTVACVGAGSGPVSLGLRAGPRLLATADVLVTCVEPASVDPAPAEASGPPAPAGPEGQPAAVPPVAGPPPAPAPVAGAAGAGAGASAGAGAGSGASAGAGAGAGGAAAASASSSAAASGIGSAMSQQGATAAVAQPDRARASAATAEVHLEQLSATRWQDRGAPVLPAVALTAAAAVAVLSSRRRGSEAPAAVRHDHRGG